MTDITTAAATPVSMLIGAEVAQIAPTADLHQVCQTLAAAGVGLLVVGDGDTVEGVVSERDVVQAIAEQRDPATTRARDVAHSTLVRCDTVAEVAVAEVAEQMMGSYVRHVLVEDDGALVGVISARDLLGNYATADVDPG